MTAERIEDRTVAERASDVLTAHLAGVLDAMVPAVSATQGGARQMITKVSLGVAVAGSLDALSGAGLAIVDTAQLAAERADLLAVRDMLERAGAEFDRWAHNLIDGRYQSPDGRSQMASELREMGYAIGATLEPEP